MKPGDLVWYRYTQRGGYGFQRDVPAMIVRVNAERVSIEHEAKNGEKFLIVVKPENLRPREA